MTRVLIIFVILGLAVAGLHGTANANHASIDSLNALFPGFVLSNIDSSLILYEEVVAESRALGYPAGEARGLRARGLALYLKGRSEEGVASTLDAIRILEELGLEQELALAYGELGYEMKRRNMGRAVEFMRRGIAIAEVNADSSTLSGLYNNYGVLHQLSDRPDSALHYYRLGLDYKMALSDSTGIPFSLNHLAELAVETGDFDTARELLRRSNAYREALQDAYGLFINALSEGDLEFEREDWRAAAEDYSRSLALPGAQGQLYARSHAHQRLSSAYEKLGDFQKAHHHHKRFAALQDSLTNVETSARIAALEIGFETEKKDRLLAENELALATRTRLILILAGSLVLLAVVAVATTRHQIAKRRQLRREMELRERLKRAEADQHLAREKLRISRDLHDSIGAQITFLTSSLDHLAHQPGVGALKTELDSLETFSRETLQELRQTVWAMREEGQGLEALVIKLQELKRRCGAAGRTLELELRGDLTVAIASSLMLNVLRIVQEAVQNALKHTADGPIRMDLDASTESLTISVNDRGPGFDPASVNHVGGLDNMRQRCEASGGAFDLESSAAGTTISCRFVLE